MCVVVRVHAYTHVHVCTCWVCGACVHMYARVCAWLGCTCMYMLGLWSVAECVHVYAYVYVVVCAHVCTCVWLGVHMYARVGSMSCTCVCTCWVWCTCTHVCGCVLTRMHMYVWLGVHVCVVVCTCVVVHVYVYARYECARVGSVVLVCMHMLGVVHICARVARVCGCVHARTCMCGCACVCTYWSVLCAHVGCGAHMCTCTHMCVCTRMCGWVYVRVRPCIGSVWCVYMCARVGSVACAGSVRVAA